MWHMEWACNMLLTTFIHHNVSRLKAALILVLSQELDIQTYTTVTS